MYFSIQETDEAYEDLFSLASYVYETSYSYNYSKKVYDDYDKAILSISIFPCGFKNTKIKYRDYSIYLLPYNIYNIFYIIENDTITVLRVLHQKRNWQRIIKEQTLYHIDNNIL